jgi:hypothetical protein
MGEPDVDIVGCQLAQAAAPKAGDDPPLHQDPAGLDRLGVTTAEPEGQPVAKRILDREVMTLNADPVIQVTQDVAQSGLGLRLTCPLARLTMRLPSGRKPTRAVAIQR